MNDLYDFSMRVFVPLNVFDNKSKYPDTLIESKVTFVMGDPSQIRIVGYDFKESHTFLERVMDSHVFDGYLNRDEIIKVEDENIVGFKKDLSAEPLTEGAILVHEFLTPIYRE